MLDLPDFGQAVFTLMQSMDQSDVASFLDQVANAFVLGQNTRGAVTLWYVAAVVQILAESAMSESNPDTTLQDEYLSVILGKPGATMEDLRTRLFLSASVGS